MLSRRFSRSFHLCTAFTLIELLVVLGIMAILAGGLGVAIRSFDGRAKMQSAQGTLIAALNSARAKAAVQQNTVCLLLNADKDDTDHYLRELIPATLISGANWTVVGESILLPNGVYVIPPNLGAAFPAKFDPSTQASDWSKITSFASAASASSLSLYAPSGGTATRTIDAFRIAKFDSLGRFDAQTTIGGQRTVLAVTLGEPKPGSGVTFRDHEQARGAWFSRYGVVLPINEKTGFEYAANDYDSR